jgi:putative ABC transport system permease protein
VLGAVQGIVIGIALGYAVILALRDEGLSSFTIPFATLVILLVGAMLLGVLAATFPARKAARLNVLEAISHS